MAVNNDFHQTHNIFSLFDGLEVKGLNEPFHLDTETNGIHPIADRTHHKVNGTQSNGVSALASS